MSNFLDQDGAIHTKIYLDYMREANMRKLNCFRMNTSILVQSILDYVKNTMDRLATEQLAKEFTLTLSDLSKNLIPATLL